MTLKVVCLCTSLVPRPKFSNDDHRLQYDITYSGSGIEVVLSAGMSPGPIKIESLRDVTLIARMFQPHLRSILTKKRMDGHAGPALTLGRLTILSESRVSKVLCHMQPFKFTMQSAPFSSLPSMRRSGPNSRAKQTSLI